MKSKNLILSGSIILVIGIIAYFLIEKSKREKELKKKNEKLIKAENENIALKVIVNNLKTEVKVIIDKKDELKEDAKQQLIQLIEEYKDIDERVATELLSCTALIEIKEETKAIMGLAKIIENLLAKIHKKNTNTERKNIRFADLINYAKKENILEKDEYHFLNGLKEIRNEEAHNLAVKKSSNIISTSIMIGISIIFKLGSIIKGF